MKLHILCAALLAASSAFAQTSPSTPQGSNAAPSVSGTAIREVPSSTGSSADTAGSGTTAPRSADTSSVGTSGAVAGTASAGTTSSTGRCDTLLGDERQKCLKEQAATGIVK